ncbi:DUF3560 domain-containing protein [Clavibacter zhangzhiyongii]|uniref:DUF3560 domain-containing protein n=1 Tax=Clavibacter zhangzhiyongii TaxID=2768071 RepID=UPI0039E0890A
MDVGILHADRVDALDAKAKRKAGAEVADDERAAAARRRLPEGGEPIKVGHHPEGRHRNAIAKAVRERASADLLDFVKYLLI